MGLQVLFDHVAGSKQGRQESFPAEQPITIGRNPTNTLQFDPNVDLDVSGNHAQIVLQPPSTFLIMDLGSRNGTFVNGNKLPPNQPFPLMAGSLVEFGPPGTSPKVRVSFVEVPDTEVVAPQEAAAPAAEEQPKKKGCSGCLVVLLVLLLGGGAGAGWWFGVREPARKGTEAARGEAEAAKAAALQEAQTQGIAQDRVPTASPAFRNGDELLAAGVLLQEQKDFAGATRRFDDSEARFHDAVTELRAAAGAAQAERNATEARDLMQRAVNRVELVGMEAAQRLAGDLVTGGNDLRDRAAAKMTERDFVRARELFDQARDRYDRAADQTVLALRLEQEQASVQAATAQAERLRQESVQLQTEMTQLAQRAATDQQARQRLDDLTRLNQEDQRLNALFSTRRDVACVVYARAYLVSRQDPSRRSALAESIGTGVIVGPGLIATAKSVIYPWRFDPQARARVQQAGSALQMDVETSVRVLIATRGAQDVFTQAFDTEASTLEIAWTPDDVLSQPQVARISFNGQNVDLTVRTHDPVQGNAAILRVRGGTITVEPVPFLSPADLAGHRGLAIQITPTGRASDGNVRLDPAFGTLQVEGGRVTAGAGLFPLGLGGPLLGLEGQGDQARVGLAGIIVGGTQASASAGGQIIAIPATVIRDAVAALPR